MGVEAATYYGLLEIEPTASAAEVRKAYFRLAKVYHPDRQVEQNEGSTEVFLAVQEAYDVLSDARRRLEYDESQRSGSGVAVDHSSAPAAGSQPATAESKSSTGSRRGPTLEEERDARMGFMKAEDFLEDGQHEQAQRLMTAVVRTVPDNPDYLSLAGYLQALEGGERLHGARDLCQKAVEAQPFNALFLARLGFVYEEVGLRARADAYYDRALAKDSKQPLASSRRRGPSAQASQGILASMKRIFGG
jgi:curved DNA-binding protein CbpA